MLAGIVLCATVAACGGSPKSSNAELGGEVATAGEQCQLLTPADVRSIAGATVQRIERGAATGAGGTCVNFASADGRAYLGVNALRSSADYAATVRAVPADVYPIREPLAGRGEGAVLFKNREGMRYLVARGSATGVVLFPMGDGAQMSDDQLRQLALRALTASP